MKYRVSYTIDGSLTDPETIRAYIEKSLDGADVEIESITPPLEEGWYQYFRGEAMGDGRESVYFWSIQELLDYDNPKDIAEFRRTHRRVKAPEPYDA